MSITTHQTTIRQWVKNHTKDEIAVFVEDQIAKRDARIEFLERGMEQATRKMETRKHTGEIVVASYCDNPCVTVGWVDSEPELAAWLKEKENAS